VFGSLHLQGYPGNKFHGIGETVIAKADPAELTE